MADFKAIADRAVEIIGSANPSQFLVAWTTMKDETVEAVKEENWESELGIMSRMGATYGDSVLSKIESVVTPRLVRMIQSEKGVNLADPETIGLISQLVGAEVLTQQEADDLLASNTETVNRWVGLTRGQVHDALSMRLAGEI